MNACLMHAYPRLEPQETGRAAPDLLLTRSGPVSCRQVAPHPNILKPWLSGKTTQSTTDMPATTYIISGAAGNHENHEPFTRPAPDRSAIRLNKYGYNRMARRHFSNPGRADGAP